MRLQPCDYGKSKDLIAAGYKALSAQRPAQGNYFSGYAGYASEDGSKIGVEEGDNDNGRDEYVDADDDALAPSGQAGA